MLISHRNCYALTNQRWSIQFQQYQAQMTDMQMWYIGGLRQYHTKMRKSITGAVATISAEAITEAIATISDLDWGWGWCCRQYQLLTGDAP